MHVAGAQRKDAAVGLVLGLRRRRGVDVRRLQRAQVVGVGPVRACGIHLRHRAVAQPHVLVRDRRRVGRELRRLDIVLPA